MRRKGGWGVAIDKTEVQNMAFDELKQKGNDCIRQKNYTEAIEFYTQAVAANPSSHAVYSNRSLAYSSVGDFERALQDATKCLELAPTFARGYLRKAVALVGLMKYEDAMIAAQEGYKLRGSDAISRDCVSQWIRANQAIYRSLVEQKLHGELDLLPRGCLVLSEEYLDIFLDALVYRAQLTNEIEPVVVSLHRTFIELDRVLHLFGHSPCPCQQAWVECLYKASKMNPSTARVPVDTVTALLAKSDEFATWLHTSVDPILYPVICPIISLAVIAVTVRSISLNVINSDQHANQVICRACLPFFEKSILSSERYVEQLLGIYKEFLEAWASLAVKFTAEEVSFLEQSIKKVEAYVKKCPKQFESYKEPTMVSIALARIRLGNEPGFDPVLYAPEHGKAVSRLVEESPGELTAYVKTKIEELEAVVRSPPSSPMPYAAQDAQDVLFCIGKCTHSVRSIRPCTCAVHK